MRRSTRRAIGMIGHGSSGANPPPIAMRPRRYQGRKRGMRRLSSLEVARGDAEVLRARDAVDEADGELEAVRVLQQSGEAGGRGVGLGVLRSAASQ